jgi:hypothetical protein
MKEKRAKLGFVILGILFAVAILLAATSDTSGLSPLPTPTSPLATPVSPLPTPTPPGGGGENGGFDWMELLEWVLENREQIVEVVLLIIALIVSWLGRGEVAKRYGVELMLEAERLARATVLETGPEKMQHVVSTLVMKLPKDVKAVLRAIAAVRGMTLDELVAELAQRWFDKVTGSD